MAKNPVQQVMDDLPDDEAPATYPVPPDRIAAMNAASVRTGGPGVVQGAAPGRTAAPPLSAATLFPAGSPYGALYQQLAEEAAARRAGLQSQMDIINQQAQQYGQKGMSDIDKASILFQAAGALAAPTRSGGLMESIGAAGTAVAGPLQRAAQAERERQDKMMQLQLARAKLASEMGTGGVSASDLLKLQQAQAEAAAAAAGKPVTMEINGEKVSGTFKGGKYYDIYGREVTPDTMPKTSDEDLAAIPESVRRAGPNAIKEFQKEFGKKTGQELISALTTADNLKAVMPVLERAENAYTKLGEAGAIGPYTGSAVGQAAAKYTKRESANLREQYMAAQAQLQYLKARIEAKGQGAITDFERRILALQLPTLDAQDPKTGLETLRLFRNELKSAIERPERIQQRGAEPAAPAGNIVDFRSLR